MTIDNKTFQLIDAYLKEELSYDEKNKFEKRLVDDPEFNLEFQTQLELFNHCDDKKWNFSNRNNPDVINAIDSIRQLDLETIKSNISVASKSYKNQSSFNYKSLMKYAAGVIVLLGLGYFIWNSSEPSNRDLYTEFKAFNELPSIASRSEDDASLIFEGEKAFKQHSYKEALDLFNAAADNSLYSSQLLIYKGLAHLELEEYQEAIDLFKELESSTALDHIKSDWYLALSYLKMNDRDHAEQFLNKILENDGNYKYLEAKALLKHLKN